MVRASGLPNLAGQDAAYWLGQAGFWIDLAGTRLLIDPYLSDSLARKYAGTVFPHERLMPIPVDPGDLPRPDAVLITHAHTDHMDPETLSVLASRFPDLPFVVPAAEQETAQERIGPDANLVCVNTGEELTVATVQLTVFPSAHETRRQDAEGRDHFLGYGLSAGAHRLYHSGDTVPFDDLTDRLRHFSPSVAFLPINGRDAIRASGGVPGNMTLSEAIALCQTCGIPRLIPHHFGLFAFNTASENELATARAQDAHPGIELPSPLLPISLGSPDIHRAEHHEQNR